MLVTRLYSVTPVHQLVFNCWNWADVTLSANTFKSVSSFVNKFVSRQTCFCYIVSYWCPPLGTVMYFTFRYPGINGAAMRDIANGIMHAQKYIHDYSTHTRDQYRHLFNSNNNILKTTRLLQMSNLGCTEQTRSFTMKCFHWECMCLGKMTARFPKCNLLFSVNPAYEQTESSCSCVSPEYHQTSDISHT